MSFAEHAAATNPEALFWRRGHLRPFRAPFHDFPRQGKLWATARAAASFYEGRFAQTIAELRS